VKNSLKFVAFAMFEKDAKVVTVHAFADLRLKGSVYRTNHAEPRGVLGVRLSERSDEPRTVKMRAQASAHFHLVSSPQNV
jgi:hypothetical protein